MKKVFFIFIVFLFIPSFLFSQQEDFRVVVKTTDGEVVKLYRGCHALVIGISDYASGWRDLPHAVSDANEVGDLLSSLGFEVRRVLNPTRDELDKELQDFVYGPGLEPDNCLVIFFAGHGHTERQAYGGERGYIIPKDSPLPEQDRAGFMRKAIDMETIESHARRIQARHVLFLFDCCFSGALFDLTRANPEKISVKTARPVRQFVTAGMADEPVQDKSIFKSQLIEALQGEADRNNDNYVTGTELGEYLQEKVENYSRETQHPQYGKIRDPNLDKGDFVFVLGTKPLLPPVQEVKTKLDTGISGKKVEQVTPIQQSSVEPVVSKKYKLQIASSPSGAKVFIDGVEKGITPFTPELLEGRYKIRIEKEGYKPREVELDITSDLFKSYNLEAISSLQETAVPKSEPDITAGEVLSMDQVDVPPKIVKKVNPIYPRVVKEAGITGVVIVQVLISENGDVVQARVIKGIKSLFKLDEAVVEAVKKWKFSPAEKGGVKVKVWWTFRVEIKNR